MTAHHALTSARRIHLRAVEPSRHDVAEEVRRHRATTDALQRLRTVAAVRPVRPVFSHWSAALVHRLPLLGAVPNTIHVLAQADTDRADRGVVQHARRGGAPVVEVRGLLVTSVARTVAGLASIASLMSGVVAADAALSPGSFGERTPATTRSELTHAAATLPPGADRDRSLAVARFADGRAESPLESVSRVSMGLAGAPPPHLQPTVEDLLGFRARVDFAWPSFGVIGEADGVAKYRRAALRRGRTPSEVLAEESRRETLIRSLGLRVVRWGWQAASRPDRRAALVRDAGLSLAAHCTIDGLGARAIPPGGRRRGAFPCTA